VWAKPVLDSIPPVIRDGINESTVPVRFAKS
jgi:hypothetical protein